MDIKKLARDISYSFIQENLPHEVSYFENIWKDIPDGNLPLFDYENDNLGIVNGSPSLYSPEVIFIITSTLSLLSSTSQDIKLENELYQRILPEFKKLKIDDGLIREVLSYLEKKIEESGLFSPSLQPENWFLQKLSPAQREKASKIRDYCQIHLNYINSQGLFKFYTDHGPGHSFRILRLMAEFCETQKLQWDPNEVYYLYLSAYCHDLGMLKLHGENFDDIETCENVRKKHHQRVHEYLLNHWREIQLANEEEAILLGNICAAHSRKVDICDLPETVDFLTDDGIIKIRARYLGAIIRLADALDMDHRRLPPEPYRENKEIPFKTDIEYWKHEIVERVKIFPQKIVVAFKIKYIYPVNMNIEEVVKNNLQDEINSIRNIFDAYNIPLTLEFNTVKSVFLKERPVFKG